MRAAEVRNHRCERCYAPTVRARAGRLHCDRCEPSRHVGSVPTTRRPVSDPPRTPADAFVEPRLGLYDVTKIYGSGSTAVAAVRDVNFEAEPGELVLIMGPSGSGKTTLLLLLGAMLRPTSGTIRIGSTDLTAAPERDLPRLRSSHIGFVFQDFNLLDSLDAIENVALACNIAGVRGRAATQRARNLLDQVGVGHRGAARPTTLSGGEKQRVAIARALANDPRVVLADEPTANLDAANGQRVAALLREVTDRDKRTCIIVSHDERLAHVADRVMWLEDGHLDQRKGR